MLCEKKLCKVENEKTRINVTFAISKHHLCDNNNENFKLSRENNNGQKIIPTLINEKTLMTYLAQKM